MFFACGIWCFSLADVSSVGPLSEQSTVCSGEGPTLKTSAKHHIPQAKNIPYQSLLIKPIFIIYNPITCTYTTGLPYMAGLPIDLFLRHGTEF